MLTDYDFSELRGFVKLFEDTTLTTKAPQIGPLIVTEMKAALELSCEERNRLSKTYITSLKTYHQSLKTYHQSLMADQQSMLHLTNEMWDMFESHSQTVPS